MHGELPVDPGDPGDAIGSSPRAWGTLWKQAYERPKERFIPTCMGNSSLCEILTLINAVHPHVHGELLNLMHSHFCNFGSSPRAWGTLSKNLSTSLFSRFIPTCMGNSERKEAKYSAGAVHPHVHGELWIVPVSARVSLGSSPRAWGTRGGDDDRVGVLRFIPTCMGNSLPNIYQKGEGYFHPSKYRIRNSS